MKSYIVDAFTEQPFKGNPAGVCLMDYQLEDALMQNIATELNFSETAFIIQLPNGKYQIRYFSPKIEIPLCGHATMASAKVLFQDADLFDIEFVTKEGIELYVKRYDERIAMQFPVYDTVFANVPFKMLDALGIDEIVNSAYNKETNSLVIEILDPDKLKSLDPDYDALVASHDSIHGVSITAKAQEEDEYDFYSRYFWPWAGTNEDPVTGAAHTFLSKYWFERLRKRQMRAFQCSPRTGEMDVHLIDDHHVLLIGQAYILFSGQMDI